MIKSSKQYILIWCSPKFDRPIPRTTSEQIIRVKCYLSNWTVMALESSQQNTRVLVPKPDGLVIRTTGKYVIRVESHCPNIITMASETSQLITRVLVPQLDTVVTGTTGEQISGVKGDWKNISITDECFQQSIIYINENNFISTFFR